MRYSAITLVLLLLSGFATAQVTLGVRAGYGQSSVRSGATFDLATDRLQATDVFSAGIFADLPLSALVSFRPGLEFAQRGTELGLNQEVAVAGVALPIGARATTTFSYVDAPLLLQLNLPTEGSIQPYAFAGPSLGYATGGKLRTTARALITEIELNNTPINLDGINYERFHVAAVGGVGARASLNNGMSVFAEARYEHGLSQPYDVPLATDKVGFRGWNLGAGVTVALQ